MIVAGIMSGTSLDGIDVAVIEITGEGWDKRVTTLATATTSYPKPVREALLAVSNRDTHTAQIAMLHYLLPELYAKAVRQLCTESKFPLQQIELIGCHGQTIYHNGVRTRFLGQRIAATLQIGNGSVLAERLGIPVVSDFRARDVAAGGQGAPLVPFVDYLLLRDKKVGRVALNIGGIANVTSIPAGAQASKVTAFDTGPGNMVMDGLVAFFTRGAKRFDRNGEIARKGKASRWLLRILLRDPFFKKKPPKSAGREDYGGEFVDHLVNTRLPFEDLVATAAAFTVKTIAHAIQREIGSKHTMKEVIVAGGGAHNLVLLEMLAAELSDMEIRLSSDYGIDVDAKEAIAFAVLAHETWFGRSSNIPSATGASGPVVLGNISPGHPKVKP